MENLMILSNNKENSIVTVLSISGDTMTKNVTKKKTPLKLYTKTGDKGMSNVINGVRIPKDDLVFEVVGTMDELNSYLGLALSIVEEQELRGELMRIQDALLNHGAVVAGSTKIDVSKVTSIKDLEKRIDFYQKNTREDWYKNFILPGGTELASRIDVARTVCRRLERVIVSYRKQVEYGANHTPDAQTDSPINALNKNLSQIQAYTNRLSDYLFALRCYINSVIGYEEHDFRAEVK